MPKKKVGQKGKNNKSALATKTGGDAKQKTSKNVLPDKENVEGVPEKGQHVNRRGRADRGKKNTRSAAADLDDHFRAMGLQIRSMIGDGNCMFRALCDQLEGNQTNHRPYRVTVVDYITQNKDDFAIYHEQEEEKSFEERLKKLHKNGTYGGHECLVAFARVYDRLVFVHQPDERITFQLPPDHNVHPAKLKQVHLLYTSGNHYDSLRLVNDSSSSPSSILLTTDEGGSVRCSKDSRVLPEFRIPAMPTTTVTHDDSDRESLEEGADLPEEEVPDVSKVDSEEDVDEKEDSGIDSSENSREPSISSRTLSDADADAPLDSYPGENSTFVAASVERQTQASPIDIEKAEVHLDVNSPPDENPEIPQSDLVMRPDALDGSKTVKLPPKRPKKLSKAEKKQQRKQGKNDRRKAEIDTGRNTEEDSLAPSHVAQIDRVTDRMRLVHV